MAILFSILAALAAGFAAIYFFKKPQESKKEVNYLSVNDLRNDASNNYVVFLVKKRQI